MVTILVAVIAGITYGNRRFEDVDRRIDDLRSDMNSRFEGLRADMNTFSEGLRANMNAGFGEIREELCEIRSMLQEVLRSRAS